MQPDPKQVPKDCKCDSERNPFCPLHGERGAGESGSPHYDFSELEALAAAVVEVEALEDAGLGDLAVLLLYLEGDGWKLLRSTQPSPESGSEPDPGDFARQVVDAHNQLDRVSISREEHDLPTRTSELVDRYIGSFEKACDLADLQPESGSGEEGERPNGWKLIHKAHGDRQRVCVCAAAAQVIRDDRMPVPYPLWGCCVGHVDGIDAGGFTISGLTFTTRIEWGDVVEAQYRDDLKGECPHCGGSDDSPPKHCPPSPTQPLQGSEKVERFKPVAYADAAMEPDHLGLWVRHLDYTALQAQLNEREWLYQEQVSRRASLAVQLQRVEAQRDSAEAAHAEAEDQLLRVKGEREQLRQLAIENGRASAEQAERADQAEARIKETAEELERRAILAEELRRKANGRGDYTSAVGHFEARNADKLAIAFLCRPSSSEVGEGQTPEQEILGILASRGCPDCKQEDPARRRERAVNELLEIAKLADDASMRARLEALASRFSYPPGAASPSTPRDEGGK